LEEGVTLIERFSRLTGLSLELGDDLFLHGKRNYWKVVVLFYKMLFCKIKFLGVLSCRGGGVGGARDDLFLHGGGIIGRLLYFFIKCCFAK
jgi:hypothetical protein